MGDVPDYVKNAINKYNSKFDRISVNLPKGTKERIKELTRKSCNAYISALVLSDLEAFENARNAPKEPEQDAQEEKAHGSPKAESKPAVQKPKKKEKSPIDLLALQAEFNARKAGQNRKNDELQKTKEENREQERQERQAEYLEIAERMRNGEEMQEDGEKERARQESIAVAQNLF